MMKPILFNTEMVVALLEDRKSCTRRIIPWEEVEAVLSSPARKGNPDLTDAQLVNCLCEPRYSVGDTIYVRETWNFVPCIDCGFPYEDRCEEKTEYESREALSEGCFIFRAGYPETDAKRTVWHPSIHMPKQAARIFRQVTEVKAERLQDITAEECVREGIPYEAKIIGNDFVIGCFSDLWDSTVKKENLPKYGWEANPWVWVYRFFQVIGPKEGEVRYAE